MPTVIPDPRFEIPSLFYPGRKPIGKVIVNDKHWAGKSAVRAYVFNDDSDSKHGRPIGNNGLTIKSGNLVCDGLQYLYEDAEIAADLNVGKISVMVKFKLESAADEYFIVADRYDQTSNGWIIQRHSFNNTWQWRNKFNGTWSTTESIAATVPNEWVILVGTYDGETMKLFINEVFQEEDTVPSGDMAAINNPLTIGTSIEHVDYFNGLIEYLYIFDRALTYEEILNLQHNPYQMFLPA